jgi:hypothetical protein
MSRQHAVSLQDRFVILGPELVSFRTERERVHTCWTMGREGGRDGRRGLEGAIMYKK